MKNLIVAGVALLTAAPFCFETHTGNAGFYCTFSEDSRPRQFHRFSGECDGKNGWQYCWLDDHPGYPIHGQTHKWIHEDPRQKG